MVIRLKSDDIRSLLPRRKADAHKGTVGRILMLCGSVGLTGAASLSAMGALRSGAGLVYLGVPASVYPIVAAKLSVPVVFPLPDFEGKICFEAIDRIEDFLQKVDVVLIGPGLGINAETEKVVLAVLKKFDGPVVLDADGISIVSKHKNVLRDRTGQTIITPHEGEFMRFAELEAIDNRLWRGKHIASLWNCIVVLKGHRTVITDGITTYLNMTGNPGMAVGGSGDVLAGVIASLIGQGLEPLEAAACGTWLHGAAGDICAKKIGYGLLPTDLLQVLPRLMK